MAVCRVYSLATTIGWEGWWADGEGVVWRKSHVLSEGHDEGSILSVSHWLDYSAPWSVCLTQLAYRLFCSLSSEPRK